MNQRARRVLQAAVAAMSALWVSAASAQSAGAFMTNPAFADPPPAQCTSTIDAQHCAAHDLRVADAEMSANYHAKRAALDTAGKKRLLQAQRAWLKSRDRDCLAKGDTYRGGSMAGVVVAQCWVTVTQERARGLAKK